jgi:hypothetical protein
MLLDYIKGHMGGNTILLLSGDQLPAGSEIELSLKALRATHLACHEGGILYPPQQGGHLKVKIVEPFSTDYIVACGGMTQVLGKALVETDLWERFGIQIREPVTVVQLETDVGIMELKVEVREGKVVRVVSDMTLFARECYSMGVYPLCVGGVEAMRVGKFLVIDGEKLKHGYPDADYALLDMRSREVLVALQRQFQEKVGLSFYDYALYDWHPQNKGDLRALYPHHILKGMIEPACGTGTVAIGIAAYEQGQFPLKSDLNRQVFKARFETGGGEDLLGPDISELKLVYKEGRPGSAHFSHSFVEITSMGQVRV